MGEDDLLFGFVHQFADIGRVVAERRVQFEFESLNTREDRGYLEENGRRRFITLCLKSFGTDSSAWT